MTTSAAGPGWIVVGVDGSASANHALRWAASAAAARGLGLRVVHGFAFNNIFYGGDAPTPAAIFDALEAQARRVASAAATFAEGLAKGLKVQIAISPEAPVPLLTDESRQASMVVLGASGRGHYHDLLIGSTAVGVVAHADCPIVVVRGATADSAAPTAGPVVLGVDEGTGSEAAIGVAFEEAAKRNVRLVAVHAWMDAEHDAPIPGENPDLRGLTSADLEQRVLADQLAAWRQKYPEVEVEQLVVRDRPRQTLIARSHSAQLVVMGSRGRGGFRGMLLGSTSQALIAHAACPVMVVRANRDRH